MLKKKKVMNNKTLTTVGAIIIALLLLSTVYAFISNAKNKKNLSAERLLTESLTSEKQAVQQELEKLKTDFAALNDKADAGAKLLAAAETELTEKNNRIYSLSRSNNNLKKDLGDFENLKAEKANLDKEFETLKTNYDKLTAQSDNLENTMKNLEAEKSDLVQKLQMIETYDTDNFEIFGSRGKNNKLTVKSLCTKKLTVNFDVPQSLSETVSFKITTPSGTIITPDDKALAWTISEAPVNLTVGLALVAAPFESPRQVSLSYSSKERLTPGEYKIQIISNDKNIGNCRVRLR